MEKVTNIITWCTPKERSLIAWIFYQWTFCFCQTLCKAITALIKIDYFLQTRLIELDYYYISCITWLIRNFSTVAQYLSWCLLGAPTTKWLPASLEGAAAICTPQSIPELRGSQLQAAVLPWKQTVLTVRSKTFSLTLCSFFSLFFVHPPSFLFSLPFILSVPSNFPRSIRRFCQAGCKTVSEQLFGKQQLGEEQKRGGLTQKQESWAFFPLFSSSSSAGETSKTVLLTLDYEQLKSK